MFTSSVVVCGFESQLGQTKDYNIGICCFSAGRIKEKEQRGVSLESNTTYEDNYLSKFEITKFNCILKYNLDLMNM
jgi:hypothetical protein